MPAFHITPIIRTISAQTVGAGTLFGSLTLYVCVTAEDGARFTNRQGFIYVIPKGTKVIDSGRRGGPLGNLWAELYYKGESIRVLMSSLEICAEEENVP